MRARTGARERASSARASGEARVLLSQVLEQAMWVLGNLAGEGVAARDAVLGAGALR